MGKEIKGIIGLWFYNDSTKNILSNPRLVGTVEFAVILDRPGAGLDARIRMEIANQASIVLSHQLYIDI